MEITEPQKKVIRELRERLNGKCGDVCPGTIGIFPSELWFNPFKLWPYPWSCKDCEKHFLWLNKDHSDVDCPCDRIPYETIDLRFSELLEEEI